MLSDRYINNLSPSVTETGTSGMYIDRAKLPESITLQPCFTGAHCTGPVSNKSRRQKKHDKLRSRLKNTELTLLSSSVVDNLQN